MKWHNTWTRDYGVQYGEVILSAYMNRKSTASCLSNSIFIPQNGNQANYILKQELPVLNKTLEDLLEDNERLNLEIELFLKCGKRYVNTAQEIYGRDLENSSDHDLLNMYQKFKLVWEEYTSYLWCMFSLNEVFSQKIEKMLLEKMNEYPKENFSDLVAFVSKPYEEASILKLNKELTKIKKEPNKEAIEALLGEYKWIACLDLHHAPWTEEEFMKYFHSYVPSQENEVKEEKIIKEFNLSKEEIDEIKKNKRLVYIKDLRDEFRRIGIFHIQKLYSEIGKRMGLELKEMSYMRNDEIINFLKNRKSPDKTKIRERFKGFLMHKEGEEWKLLSNEKEIKEKVKELEFQEKEEMNKEVKGKIASMGIARGKVKIILTAKDLNKVHEGDILVALTTGPDYVPAMVRAAAFVTDEGGLTCHAAIVAREMKKPCIVGTGNATKQLKDGELVEVNCNTGIVKKLN